MTNAKKILMAAGAMTVGVMMSGNARAAVVWAEDFSDDTAGEGPQQNYVIGTTNDWAANSAAGANGPVGQTVSGSVGNAAPSYYGSDQATNNSSSANVSFARFAAFNTTQAEHEKLTVSFDYRIDSFIGNGASTFRFNITDSAATPNIVSIGLGQANIDAGDTSSELFFFATAGTSAGPTPGAANAIGGTTFEDYNSATATANDTNDAFYRFTLTFTNGSATVEGTLALASDPNAILGSFSRTGGSGFSFSNASGANADTFGIVLPQGGTGEVYVDNIRFETSGTAVPEPTTLGIIGLGTLGLLSRRKR